MLLGDQVYADEVSPETLAFIRKRRDIRKPPGEEIADFEEYTRLYRESWSDPAIRWLLSTVSCSMVIDDHDIHDDWNISAAWVEEMREHDWWAERESAGLAAYWLYQFIGNLSPELLRESELLAAVREAEDGWEILREVAADERGIRDGARWSYCRDLDRTRLLVRRLALRQGARGGQALDARRRRMGVARGHLEGDFDHLLIATSDPFLLAPGLHHMRALGRGAVRGGLGRPRRRAGEELRRRSTSTTGRRSASRSSASRA